MCVNRFVSGKGSSHQLKSRLDGCAISHHHTSRILNLWRFWWGFDLSPCCFIFMQIIQSNIFIHQGLPPKWRELQENQKDLAVWYSRVLLNILIKRYGNWCYDIARINQKDEHIWRTSSNACFLLTLLFRSFQAQNVLGRNVRLLTFGVSLDI